MISQGFGGLKERAISKMEALSTIGEVVSILSPKIRRRGIVKEPVEEKLGSNLVLAKDTKKNKLFS